ncbi:MAG: UDP-N-acetylmuramoyl-L-alanyl-D-glutamate--2,6-diaminopimelate ligase, partial [Saprospiraceae bacterium]
SRKVKPNSLFFAIRGFAQDGHQYIDRAIAMQAGMIVCEQLPTIIQEGITYVKVQSASKAAGQMASSWYDHPSRKLKLVGITGTNGKTTTVTLLHQLMQALQKPSGLLSTIENKIQDEVFEATHTTPDAIRLNALLAEMAEKGCEYAFMEVSSHAADQERIAGLRFTGGVFTNITHDHLDYHGDFKSYLYAKKKFFDDLPESAFALSNLDDKNGNVIVQNTKAAVKTYSLRSTATFRGKVSANTLQGLIIQLDGVEVHTRLVGQFNAYNLLTAYAVASLLGVEKEEILLQLSNIQAARGRFETVICDKESKLAIVDYAHTPDALEKVLMTIREIRKQGQRIVTVVGCGGDRDKTKRPLMGKIGAKLSDQLILTSDNPRTEDPVVILEGMLSGIDAEYRKKTLMIIDRKEAIRTACMLAQTGDIILIAGKGHETYQEIQGLRYPFDDRQLLIDTLCI